VTREDVAAERAVIAVSEYTGKGESILVVDDVREQRDLAAGMLRTLNYVVSAVASGEEALAHLKEHDVDLLVLDMIMDPGLDGLDTYKGVLTFRPTQRAIIVFLGVGPGARGPGAWCGRIPEKALHQREAGTRRQERTGSGRDREYCPQGSRSFGSSGG
jgi:hypothetical protein